MPEIAVARRRSARRAGFSAAAANGLRNDAIRMMAHCGHFAVVRDADRAGRATVPTRASHGDIESNAGRLVIVLCLAAALGGVVKSLPGSSLRRRRAAHVVAEQAVDEVNGAAKVVVVIHRGVAVAGVIAHGCGDHRLRVAAGVAAVELAGFIGAEIRCGFAADTAAAADRLCIDAGRIRPEGDDAAAFGIVDRDDGEEPPAPPLPPMLTPTVLPPEPPEPPTVIFAV